MMEYRYFVKRPALLEIVFVKIKSVSCQQAYAVWNKCQKSDSIES
jgi:hypothetical protein